MDLTSLFVKWSSVSLEVAGIGVIVLSALVSLLQGCRRFLLREWNVAVYEQFRRQLMRGILLGLEFLVAADIIRTVAIEPTFTSVGVLAIIVLIRTFLSFALELEISGKWPWQQGKEGQ
jgi:uncharacterized membrane protein